ncbi:MAG: hypothetical protein PHG53_10395, partial [Phycisphaerae bacterium]|nr:hypothetical protein [Phycisphaerae bacterium]
LRRRIIALSTTTRQTLGATFSISLTFVYTFTIYTAFGRIAVADHTVSAAVAFFAISRIAR